VYSTTKEVSMIYGKEVSIILGTSEVDSNDSYEASWPLSLARDARTYMSLNGTFASSTLALESRYSQLKACETTTRRSFLLACYRLV
jgi:hypothetical protein